jgi:ABC-type transport system involved in multi-copper enzyme maturation permease subunit
LFQKDIKEYFKKSKFWVLKVWYIVFLKIIIVDRKR